jgi:hypothetical protein
MCDVCPADDTVFAYLVGFVFFISLLVWLFSRRIRIALITLSILINLVLILFIDGKSPIFFWYHVEWLKGFSIYIWPILNIIFIILYVRRTKDKQD